MSRRSANNLVIIQIIALFGLVVLLTSMIPTRAKSAENTEVIELLTYHTHAPFLTGKESGLTYDLAKYLDHAAKGRYQFKVVATSRPRLDAVLADNQAIVVPWVNPAWFKDKERQKYLWSDQALLDDAGVIISNAKAPIEYDGPEVLLGKVLGGLYGHRYVGIDDFNKDGKTIRRVNASNHEENLHKLALGDIDATLMPLSAAKYELKTVDNPKAFYISKKLQDSFQRFVLVGGQRRDLLEFINLTLNSDIQGWQSIIQPYE